MFFLSYKFWKYRHDKIGNCACAEIVTPLSARGFKSVYSSFISLGVSFALMTFFTFEKVTFWVDRCLSKNITSLFSNLWIIGTKYRGMLSSSCRLILSQVNSSALRSEWRLMLLLHLGNKDCLNPGKTGCFLYLFWFIVCLKSLFELLENNLALNVCKRSQRSFTISCFRKRWWILGYCLYDCTIIYKWTILNLNEDWKRMRWRARTSTKVECAWKSLLKTTEFRKYCNQEGFSFNGVQDWATSTWTPLWVICRVLQEHKDRINKKTTLFSDYKNNTLKKSLM